jgi:hypothetical protein
VSTRPRPALRPPVPVLLVGSLVAALVVQTWLAGPAHAAGLRYASPTGTSAQSCLTPATACNLDKAVNSASTGDEVVVTGGTYDLSVALTSTAAGLNVHGTVGQLRPVINSSAASALTLKGSGARVSDLTIVHTGGLWGLNLLAANVVAQRLEVRSTGLIACGVGFSGTARELLCLDSAANGVALDDSWSADTGTLVVRGATLIATGAGSYGIRAEAQGNDTNLDLDARNVIASGVAADVRSNEVGTNSESDVVMRSSNYDAVSVAGGGFVTAAGSPTNQVAAPQFADAAFHEATASPTVDAGTTDASTGTFDLDGESRPYGAAMDIGVDEVHPDTTPPDTVVTHRPRARTHRRTAGFTFTADEHATFTCVVDSAQAVPCTSPFEHRFRRYGEHVVAIVAADAAGNLDPTPAVCTWKIKRKRSRHHPHHHHSHHHH